MRILFLSVLLGLAFSANAADTSPAGPAAPSLLTQAKQLIVDKKFDQAINLLSQANDKQLDRPTLQKMITDCADLRRNLKAKNVMARWADLDERFHREIALASGNRRLAQDIFRYRLVHRGFNTIRFTEDLIPQSLLEHERVLAAIDTRDVEAARAAMTTHLREWQAYYVRSFAG